MGLFLIAFASVVVLAMVLVAVDVNITQTRRIEKQVERDRRRIHRKTLRGWSADRIADRYPELPIEQIRLVRREIARSLAAVEEVGRLEAIWTISIPEPEYER
ncbi:MAG: hypothetical protein ACR2OI_07945 [Acidimicrobiia bacterium]